MAFPDLLMIYRLQIAAVCFTLLVAIPFFAVKREKDFACKLFTWLLVFQMLSLAGDIITVYTVNNMAAVPPHINDICHIFFITALFVFIYTTFLYIRHQVTGDESIAKLFYFGIPVVLSVAVLIITPIEYNETAQGFYSAGFGVSAIYTILGIYLVAMLFLLLRYGSRINGEKRRTLMIAVLTEFFISGVQLFIPYILISSLGTTIIVVAIYLTIENPDRILRDMYQKAYKTIKDQNRTIVESLNYAGKIQENLLPKESSFRSLFSDYAVIWKPRDIVGGDVYWLKEFDNGTVLCVADCTGHGTPGALLTMLVVSALEAIVWESSPEDTAEIIWQLDRRLSDVLHVGSDTGRRRDITDIDDGCDIAALFIAKDGSVRFSSAKVQIFVCDGNEVVQHRGQKLLIGEGKLISKDEVEVTDIPAASGSKFYIASDGLFEQIGDATGTQFGYDAFKQILLLYHDEKLSSIADRVWDAYEHYRGTEARRDDFELVAFEPRCTMRLQSRNKGDGFKVTEDLFAVEQKIFEEASAYSRELQNGESFDHDKWSQFVKEYGRLLRQLRRATRVSDRTTGNLQTHKEDLQSKVDYDSLTGIHNRRYLDENLLRVVKSAARAGSHLCVMMLDIDNFKKYNDTYGHGAGDVCLKTVAQTIAGCLSRPDDFAVRYGGEEFAVILPNTDRSGARVMASKILDAVKAQKIPHEKNEAYGCVTVSIGLTACRVGHGHTGDDFIKRADKALYQSKQDGRNMYTFLDMEGKNGL